MIPNYQYRTPKAYYNATRTGGQAYGIQQALGAVNGTDCGCYSKQRKKKLKWTVEND
jgi:hypothetical protein